MIQLPKVNSHIHTPYSFSAFDSIEHAVRLAKEQDIAALGISDFNVTEGYSEFASRCLANGVYPMFCMETITLSTEDKKAGCCFNDANPGIMYYCFKGLDSPVTFSKKSSDRLSGLWAGTQDHIKEMILRVNKHSDSRGIFLNLEYEAMKKRYTRNTVRERHLCRAIFDAMNEKYAGSIIDSYRNLFADLSYTADISSDEQMQNEIRSRLLKSGKPAFVEENSGSFMNPFEAREVCLSGGGIPCYPVLADDKAGFSHYEKDPDVLSQKLAELGICFVEFIPQRNTMDSLIRYVKAMSANGFPVVFGTEHNTPKCIAMEPMARGNVKFTQELAETAWQGACIIAAHQKMRKKGNPGFVDSTGKRLVEPGDFKSFAKIGADAISGYASGCNK